MARLHDIVFDCRHPASLARFWAEALDDYDVAPYDDAELDRLHSLGIAGPEDDPTVLVAPRGPGPRLFFQLVPEGKVVKNRVHLDLRCDDVQTEVARLVALGAHGVGPVDDRLGDTNHLLTDPEGNELCCAQERPEG